MNIKNNLKNPNTNGFAYSELLNEYCLNLKNIRNENSTQSIKNARTATRAWCNTLEIKLTSLVSDEFKVKFNTSVKKFTDLQKKMGLKATTYNSRVSIIRSLRKFYLKKEPLQHLPEKFNERLKYVLTINDYSPKQFWEHHLSSSITYDTFGNWLSGEIKPAKRNHSFVKKIEEELSLAPGVLSCLLRKTASSSPVKTTFQKRQQKFCSKPYYCWTDSVDQEFNDLVDYKTAVIPPLGLERADSAVWSRNEADGICHTAMHTKNKFTNFFGFCHLPTDNEDPLFRGLGISKEDISLALLSKVNLVEEYITKFRFIRNNESYNEGDLNFLSTVISLLRPDFGYLYQKSEFAKKIGLRNDKKLWQSKCIETRNRLIIIRKSIEKEKKNRREKLQNGKRPQGTDCRNFGFETASL